MAVAADRYVGSFSVANHRAHAYVFRYGPVVRLKLEWDSTLPGPQWERLDWFLYRAVLLPNVLECAEQIIGQRITRVIEEGLS